MRHNQCDKAKLTNASSQNEIDSRIHLKSHERIENTVKHEHSSINIREYSVAMQASSRHTPSTLCKAKHTLFLPAKNFQCIHRHRSAWRTGNRSKYISSSHHLSGKMETTFLATQMLSDEILFDSNHNRFIAVHLIILHLVEYEISNEQAKQSYEILLSIYNRLQQKQIS